MAIRRGTQTLGQPNVVPGAIVLDNEGSNLTNSGRGTPVVPVPPVVVPPNYQHESFYLTTEGQTRNDSGNPITPKALSDFNAAAAQWGYSFPGASGDINQWARTIQLPANYDSTRPIIATFHMIPYSLFDVTGFRAYWAFENPSNSTVPDETGNGNNGVPSTTTITSVAGRVAQGAGIPTSVYYVVANAPSLVLTGSDYTVWWWVKKNSISSGGAAITTSVLQWNFNWFRNSGLMIGQFDIYYGGVGQFTRLSPVTVSENDTQWRFFMVDYTASTKIARLYSNCASQTVLALDDTQGLTSASIFPGADLHLGVLFDCTLDEMGIAARLLTPTEKDCIFNAGLGSTYPNFCN